MSKEGEGASLRDRAAQSNPQAVSSKASIPSADANEQAPKSEREEWADKYLALSIKRADDISTLAARVMELQDQRDRLQADKTDLRLRLAAAEGLVREAIPSVTILARACGVAVDDRYEEDDDLFWSILIDHDDPQPLLQDFVEARKTLARIADYEAQGMEARRAETGTGSVHDSPVPQECAQDTPAKQHKD